MIWLVLIALLLLALVYLITPLLAPVPTSESDTQELALYRKEAESIDTALASGAITEDEAADQRRDLERRVLGITRQRSEAHKPSPNAIGLVAVTLIAVPVTLYTFTGSPELAGEVQEEHVAQLPPELANASLPELVATLEQQLAEMETPDPNGYVILARTRMQLGRFDDAIAAYDRAVALLPDEPRLADERASALDFIASQTARAPALDQGAVDAMAALTPEDRLAAIEGMVEGLEARLQANPDDLAGWTRLIRSQLVLGQVANARANLANARTSFSEDPAALSTLDALATELNLTPAASTDAD